VLKNINLHLLPCLFLYCFSVSIFFSVKYHERKFTPERLRAITVVDLPADVISRFIMLPLWIVAQKNPLENIANYLERIINNDSEFIDYHWRQKENQLDSFGSVRQNRPSNFRCKLLSVNPCLWQTVCDGYSFCVCVQTNSENTQRKCFNFVTFVSNSKMSCALHCSFYS
jgi:hypothetical protein